MSKTKLIIFISIAIAILFMAYSYLTGDSKKETLLAEEEAGLNPVGREFILLLDKLNSIKLDQSLFASPAFQSLKDSSVSIPSEAVGRGNPFAPIGAPDNY